jgi:hypothetical protein
MNEESSQFEQYCSAYYDKHGLYNDGFPCPSDKYCCQNNEGMKYCCLKNSQPVKSLVGNPQTAFNLYTTLSNSIKYNKLNDDPSQNSYMPRQKQANPADDLTSQVFSNSTSLFISKWVVYPIIAKIQQGPKFDPPPHPSGDFLQNQKPTNYRWYGTQSSIHFWTLFLSCFSMT